MDINLKGPRALILDVSSITSTIDEGNELSPLSWQKVVEMELVEKANLTIVSTVPRCPSLSGQYRTLKALLERYSLNIAEHLGPQLLAHLQEWVVEIQMTTEWLVIILRKPIKGVIRAEANPSIL